MEKITSVNDSKILKDDHTSKICARSSNKDSYWSWKNNNINGCDHQDDNSVGDLGGGGDLLGFSWPPRSYTCTFCKREFRSAQALGGHMNVHRRDRARLRQTIPSSQTTFLSSNYTLLNLNLHPNPNPNPSNLSPYFSSSSTPKMLSTTHPSNCLCPRSGASFKSQIPSFRVCKFDSYPSDNEGNRSENIVRLNLEIGLLGETDSDDLDLELRLGCA